MTVKLTHEELAAMIRESFSFLERDGKAEFVSSREMRGDPRDQYTLVRYENPIARIEVAVNQFELAAGALVYLKRDHIDRNLRYVHLEPFAVFVSDRQDPPIVPQIYYGMSTGTIQRAMREREALFKDTSFAEVLRALGAKLSAYYDRIMGLTDAELARYQKWYASYDGK